MWMTGLGAEVQAGLRRPGPWGLGRGGFGECLPNPGNYVEIDKDKLDAWRIPTLKIHCDWSENERAMSRDIAIQAAEMLAAAGAKDIYVFQEITPPGLAIHEMGTARMGRDPKSSVLNAHNQAHDAKNLFMPACATIPSSSSPNPPLPH